MSKLAPLRLACGAELSQLCMKDFFLFTLSLPSRSLSSLVSCCLACVWLGSPACCCAVCLCPLCAHAQAPPCWQFDMGPDWPPAHTCRGTSVLVVPLWEHEQNCQVNASVNAGSYTSQREFSHVFRSLWNSWKAARWKMFWEGDRGWLTAIWTWASICPGGQDQWHPDLYQK